MPGWASYLWYELVYWSSLMFFTLGFSLRLRGRRNVPRRGPVLLIANHQSFFDPFLIGLTCSRHPTYLARLTLFQNRLLALLIRSVNGVPIDHTGLGKGGLQTVLAKLREGRPVVVYPEGTRSGDGSLQALKPGIYLLIKKAKVPVVAVGIAGAHDLWPRTRKLPCPAPLFLPPYFGSIGVSVGMAYGPHWFEHMSREEALGELHEELQRVQQRAEKLRRPGEVLTHSP